MNTNTPHRLAFYVARRSPDPNSAPPVEAVGNRGSVRFYNDPMDAHSDADRRGGRSAGFVVLAVFIGDDGNPTTPRINLTGRAAPQSSPGT
jgi:hypothetical protein